MKETYHMMISSEAKKTSDKIQSLFIKPEIEGSLLKSGKGLRT